MFVEEDTKSDSEVNVKGNKGSETPPLNDILTSLYNNKLRNTWCQGLGGVRGRGGARNSFLSFALPSHRIQRTETMRTVRNRTVRVTLLVERCRQSVVSTSKHDVPRP